jgi:6,7-dimethyl-8-ribityllumazine synthase
MIEPAADPSPIRVAVVAARFNEALTEKLLAGTLMRLQEHGVREDKIHVLRVPGAYEVPFAAQRLAATGHYRAIVCLACLVRGETPHFEYISDSVTHGIMRVMLDAGVPCAYGVLTCDTEEQAAARVGGAMGHKGAEAADAALELARLAAAIDARVGRNPYEIDRA